MTPWDVARQTPLSMGFSRQEYWHGLPFPSPGDLPDPGVAARSPALQADSLPSEPPKKALSIEIGLIYSAGFVSAFREFDSVIHRHFSFFP